MAVSTLRRLNVGPGAHYAEGWVNVDRHDLPHHDHRPDVLGDILEGLDLPSESFDQVYVGHVCEHLPYHRVPDAVAECWRLLAPGGRLAVVGPCLELAVRTKQPQWLLEQICANPTPEAPGLGHEWTPTALLTLLAVQRAVPGAELVDVAEVDRPDWPNPTTAPWQCAILATKPEV